MVVSHNSLQHLVTATHPKCISAKQCYWGSVWSQLADGLGFRFPEEWREHMLQAGLHEFGFSAQVIMEGHGVGEDTP